MARLIERYQFMLDKYSRGKIILILTIITLSVYAYIMFYSIPMVMAYGGGLKVFDVRPLGYSADYAFSLLAALGETGRHLYLTRQIAVDMIYPGLFAITFSLLLTFLLKKAFGAGRWLYRLSAVPLLAGLFDYFENAGIIIMLTSYPDFNAGIAVMTSVFSVSKSFFTTIFWLFLIFGLLAAGIKILSRTGTRLKLKQYGSRQ